MSTCATSKFVALPLGGLLDGQVARAREISHTATRFQH